MTLSQAIVYYIFAFVVTLAFIICGCYIGAILRKKKDAKSATDTGISDTATNGTDVSENK